MGHDDGPFTRGAMTPPLTCTAEDTFPVATLRVAGVLSATTAVLLRRSALKCLAEQPAAMIVDLSEARLADHSSVRVLTALARRASRWPGCLIVAHSPDPAFTAAFARLAVSRSVPLLPDRAAALARVADCPVPALITEDLPVAVSGPALARAVVRDTCQRWQLPQLAPRAEVVVTELVGNAVRHACGPLRLTVSRLGPRLQLAVRDGSPEPPRLRPPVHESDPSGRGLLIVDAYATWGTFEAHPGKIVWASLRDQWR